MITIRLATIDDAAECLAIYTPYVEGTAISFEYAVPSIDDFRSRMDKTLTEYPYLVAVKEGKVLGYAYAGPFHTRAAFKHAAEVSIYIDRNHRGLGIGKRLYAAPGTIQSVLCVGYQMTHGIIVSRSSDANLKHHFLHDFRTIHTNARPMEILRIEHRQHPRL